MSKNHFKKNLVSVLTPCYNGAKTMDIFLNSLLKQTYRPIELIFINDASTDTTHSIFQQWQSILQKNNIKITYIQSPKNGGIGHACNLGLPYVTGEFFTQFDSDDIMLPTRIEKLVHTLKNNPECDIVYHPYDVVSAENTEKTLYQIRLNPDKTNMLMNLLQDESWIGQCGYLMRTKKLAAANPTLKIYPSRIGQNFQIQIPINYFGTYCYLDEILSKYIIYPKSLSHKTDKTKLFIFWKHWNEIYRIYNDTIKQMDLTKNQKKYLLGITKQTTLKRKKDFITAKIQGLKKSFKTTKKQVKNKIKAYLKN